MKQNDWIVATINNPTFDAGDFQHISDMTLDNTQLLSKDQYLKSRYIRENDLFKDSQGLFSEELFNRFYQGAAQRFAEFSTENIVDNYEYSMWDVMRPSKGKVKESRINLEMRQNPEHISIGIAGFNEVTKSNKSQRELAQNSKIFDPASGKYLDVSVNDLSFWDNPVGYFKSLFDDPLVYATYDLDETEVDPFTGNTITHKKGEWKLNDDGEYYTERLNGRSLIGKQVVSASDYLTSENSAINKYDFFDSDDIEKSVGGTIAKNLAAVLPMFVPYVNTVYSGLLVGREISKSLPMLYGMAVGFTGSDNVDSKLLNTMAAYGQRMSGSTSDYAQEHTFNFENFGNLMSDVALQWGQQKFIANTFSKLSGGGEKAINAAYAKAQGEYLQRAQKGLSDVFSGKLSEQKLIQYIGTSNPMNIGKEMIETGKWMETAFGKAALNKYLPAAQKLAESRMRTGQDLSLVYMAIVSNTDVYQSVLEKGGTPFEAAAIALGSTIGMFSVDKYLGLGEMFFNDEPARRAIREAARHNAELLMGSAGIRQAAQTETKKGIMRLIQRGMDVGKKAVSDYHTAIKDRTLGFVGKSLGEGLEEVSEELVADVSKYMGELAGKLGYFSQTDYGAGENAFERYAMSFLGGAAGGGLFYGVEAFQNRNHSSKEFQNELTYLLRQGKKDEIFAELDRLKGQGKLGSTNLSYNTTKDENGNPVYLSANEENESQSDYIYNTLKKTINQLDMILNENQINLSEDELFDRMVQGEYRAAALTDFLRGDSRENAKEISYITRYQEDFQELVNKIVDKEAEIQGHINSTPDAQRRDATFQQKLDKLNAEKQLLLELRDYLFGEGSLGYVEKMLFAMDTSLSGRFVSLTYDQFVRHNAGKSVKDLTEQEKEYYSKQYENYSKNKKMELDEAFKLFKDMQAKINPEIQNLQGRDLSREIEQFKKIAELDPFAQYLNFDSRLEGESDEDYNDRYTKREGESEQDFEARFQARQAAISQYNENHLTEWISQLSQNPIDRSTFRTLQARIGVLRKNVYNRIIELLQIPGNTELQQKIWNIIKTTGTDKKNRRNLYKQIRTAVYDAIREDYINQYKGRLNLDQWDAIKMDLEGLSMLDPDDKRNLGLPDNFDFDPNVPLTKGDIYSVIHAYVASQAMRGNIMSADDVAAWLENSKLWDFGENDQGAVNKSILDFYVRVESGITSLTDDEATEVVEITEDYMNQLVKDASKKEFDNIKKLLTSNIFKDLETNPDLKALTDLENVSFINNPVLPILKQISQKLRNSDVNIEQFLEEIYQQYQSGETAREFQLTDAQVKTLEEFKQDLEMAKAFIYAASVKSSYENPVGHNKSVNEFIVNHSGVFGTVNPLPEIDELTANFLINEANKYSSEINRWIERSQKNTADKVQKFIDSEVAFNKARLEYYKVNRDAFKINPTLDLLDGYESIALDDSLASLVQVEELLHRNYKKAIKSGVTLEQILDALLPKIVKIDSLKSQLIAKLDDTVEYNKLTDYDKLALLVSNFALSSADFYTKLRDFITNNANLAPLSIQEYAARLAQAQQQNPQVVNAVLLYLNDKLKLPILRNTTIITGVGGSGKTQAVARLSTSNGEDTWLSGPTSSLIDNLLEALPKGTSKSKEELFKIILGEAEANEFLNSVIWNEDKKRWEDKTNGKYYTKTPGLDGNTTVQLKDNIKVNKIADAPKLIVIDEATHFSTAELQLIGKFAEENGINVILLGDDNQNGRTAPGLMQNMGREYMLAWRTPKLFISLRDNNVQKINNLTSTISIMDQLSITSGVAELEEATKNLLEGEFGKLTFKYFNGDLFFGELITDSIGTDVIGKLTGKIGFIGTEQSPHYQQLKDAGKDVVLVNPVDVQGREFDYVIVDRDDLTFNIDRANLAQTGIDMMKFMKDLYTMISRSRKGTILIDNGLSKLVANVEDEFTGESSNIKNAIEKFRTTRLQQIEDALSKIQPEQEEETPQPAPAPSNEIEGTNTTTEELEEETEPVDEGNSARLEEVAESEKQEEQSYLNMTTPVRVYSNVSYSGIDTTQDVWANPDDSMRDLGIFLRAGETISEGKDKFELVKRLMEVKSIFNYGTTYYDRLPPQTKRLISKEEFENAQYFISVEDESPNNQLVGLTNLDSDKRTINGKVITLVARFKGRNGETFTVTLGGLANPETWEKNEGEIRAAIQRRIDNGDENSAELLAYLDGLSNNILAYKNKIAELSKTNQEYRINKPNFSGLTTLVKAGSDLRLENINSKFSPFNEATAYAVKSKVYSIVDDIPGLKMTYTDAQGRERTLKGRAVMFVSSNAMLRPDELEQLYMAQKQDPTLVPQVRMIVLDNQGVSFASLYRKSYKDIYTISKGDVLYTTPFKLEPMAIRMYTAAWNFRSNLKRFMKVYNEWVADNNLDQKTIEDLCKLDNAEYSRIRGDQEYLSEEDYRSQVSDDVKDKLKLIWDFNDSLATSVRQFRLGYSSLNGAYIRKLTNLKEGGFYENIDNTLGIYINPSMAIQFDGMLYALFENIINKIVPTDLNPLQYIDTNLTTGWFQNVDKNREITIKMYDDEGKELNVDLNILKENALTALPSILIETAKFLSIRGINPDSFDQYLNENLDERYFIKFGDEVINWRSLADALDGGQVQVDENVAFSEGAFQPGIRPYSNENGVKSGVIDKRIDNMFSLMFHGMTSTSVENDFNRGDIRATDAAFKFGFFADPILESNNGTAKSNAPVATNRKLFSANVVPGLPIIGISFEEFQETTPEVKPAEEATPTGVNAELEQSKAASVSTLANSGITLTDKALSKVNSIEDLYNLVNSKINAKFVEYFDNQDTLPLENLIKSVKIVGNNLEFTYFTSSPELNGESIQSYEWKGKALVITTSGGKKYSVQNVLGNLTWTEVSDPNPVGRTVGDVISQINETISGLSEFIEADESEQIQAVIQDAFRGNQESTVASEKLIQRALNKVQEKLKDFEDESDAEWTSKLNEALSNLKNIRCVI